MDNIILFRVEVLVFFSSLLYIFYYIFDYLYNVYFNIKNIIKPVKKEKTESNFVKLKIEWKEKNYKKNSNITKLSELDKEKIKEILKKVRWNILKWYVESAKNLVIEWLSIDKFNKDLNLELALIYQKEKNYKKSKYIYKELSETYPNDLDILERLAFILALEKEFKSALKVYEKVFLKNKWNVHVVDILSNINFEIKDFKKALKYSKIFLREKPRNVDKLTMTWVCLEELDRKDEAIIYYKKILEVQPYNSFAIERVRELEKYRV